MILQALYGPGPEILHPCKVRKFLQNEETINDELYVSFQQNENINDNDMIVVTFTCMYTPGHTFQEYLSMSRD